jgi:hypothetical protein
MYNSSCVEDYFKPKAAAAHIGHVGVGRSHQLLAELAATSHTLSFTCCCSLRDNTSLPISVYHVSDPP